MAAFAIPTGPAPDRQILAITDLKPPARDVAAG